MAGPIALAALLSKFIQVTCPHCRNTKMVLRGPAAYRVCSSCHKQFPDPGKQRR